MAFVGGIFGLTKQLSARQRMVALLGAAVIAGLWLTFLFSPRYIDGQDVLRLSANPRHAGIRLYDGRTLTQTFAVQSAANAIGLRLMKANTSGNFIIQILPATSESPLATVKVSTAEFMSNQDYWIKLPRVLTADIVYRLRLTTEDVTAVDPLAIAADYERDSSYPEGLVIVSDSSYPDLVHRQGNIALRLKYFFSRRERWLLR